VSTLLLMGRRKMKGVLPLHLRLSVLRFLLALGTTVLIIATTQQDTPFIVASRETFYSWLLDDESMQRVGDKGFFYDVDDCAQAINRSIVQYYELPRDGLDSCVPRKAPSPKLKEEKRKKRGEERRRGRKPKLKEEDRALETPHPLGTFVSLPRSHPSANSEPSPRLTGAAYPNQAPLSPLSSDSSSSNVEGAGMSYHVAPPWPCESSGSRRTRPYVRR
jgi:hypothetical protein